MSKTDIEILKLANEVSEMDEELLKSHNLLDDFHRTMVMIMEIYRVTDNDWEMKAYIMLKLAERMCAKMDNKKCLEGTNE